MTGRAVRASRKERGALEKRERAGAPAVDRKRSNAPRLATAMREEARARRRPALAGRGYRVRTEQQSAMLQASAAPGEHAP